MHTSDKSSISSKSIAFLFIICNPEIYCNLIRILAKQCFEKLKRTKNFQSARNVSAVIRKIILTVRQEQKVKEQLIRSFFTNKQVLKCEYQYERFD